MKLFEKETTKINDDRARLLAQRYLENGCNKTEAWLHVTGSKYDKPSTANVVAHNAFERESVKKYLEKYRRFANMRHEITIDKLLAELEEARQLAINGSDNSRPVASAAVNATMGKAKLLGLDKQVIDHISSDGSLKPSVIQIAPLSKDDNCTN